MKRMLVLLLPFTLLSGCAVGTYSTYPDYPVYSAYPAVQEVYMAPPVYAVPGITFGLGIHGGYGNRRHYGATHNAYPRRSNDGHRRGGDRGHGHRDHSQHRR